MKFVNHVVLSVFFLVMGLLALPTTVLAGPQAVFPELQHDFGILPEKGRYNHTFIVQNTGDSELVLEQIIPDCGCATVEYDRSIAPGDTGKITVAFNSTGYKGVNVTRKIKVVSNAQTNNVVYLQIAAQVVAMAEISPPRVSFTGIIGENMSGTVAITPSDEYPFRVLSAEARSGYNISFEFKEELAGGSPVYYVTVYNTKTTAGRYADEIILKTDNKVVPEVSFKVYGTILPSGY